MADIEEENGGAIPEVPATEVLGGTLAEGSKFEVRTPIAVSEDDDR